MGHFVRIFVFSSNRILRYSRRGSKFGTGVPAKGPCKTIYVGSMPASMPAKPLQNNPLPPWALPKFEVRKVYIQFSAPESSLAESRIKVLLTGPSY